MDVKRGRIGCWLWESGLVLGYWLLGRNFSYFMTNNQSSF